MHNIGKISKTLDITIRTLRYYDEIDLLKPSHISEAGYRYYSEEDILQLQRILTLKKLGFHLEQIKTILTKQDWKTVFEEHLELIQYERKRIMYMENLIRLSLNVSLTEGNVNWKDINIFLNEDETSFHNEYFRKQRIYMRQHFSDEEYEKLTRIPKLDHDTEESKELVQIIGEFKDYRHLSPIDPKSQQLASRFHKLLMQYVEGDEELLSKYWYYYKKFQANQQISFLFDKETIQYIDSTMDVYQKENLT
ncbi:MerR family transcriptional regulator [Shimazuella alba]|uniref:MerR family transcriptional regulator n=1 Tax=Shimazuella alba TaxID=2690964 RepID=A0A6I4VS48_9BACL|nr:MerR family transcriptional regulator [Shimazuella alba]MXQ53268.1 MerR family transcriptional regulator [Shimazuella alba]